MAPPYHTISLSFRTSLGIAISLGLALATSLCLPGISAEELLRIEERKRDPFLEKMLQAVTENRPTQAELEQIATYINQHPSDPDGHLVMANAYNKLGMDSLYAEELVKAWRLNPNALFYVISALKARAIGGDIESFNALVDEAFKTYNKDPRKLNAMALVFQSNKQNKTAVQFLQRAMELEPKNLLLREDYCNSLLAQRQYKTLLSATSELFVDGRGSPRANLLKGLALYNLNEIDLSIPLLKSSFEATQNSPEVALAYSAALVSAGKAKQALEPALTALALQPIADPAKLDSVKANTRPIIARSNPKDLDDAMNIVAAKFPPGRALAYFYFSMGDILDKLGRVRQASDCYSSGLQIDKSFGRAFMRLAHDLELIGAPPDIVMELYEQAALRTQNDQQVKASYLRMKQRLPAQKTDIAAHFKSELNNLKYKQ